MPNPSVSIIIPVYNVESYLDQCLKSILDQTLKDIEIICIDDGSTDGSSKKLDQFSSFDERINVIHQKNAGVSHARNVGIDKACGDYVLFVDSDDYIASFACETLYRLACESKADIVVFGGKTFPTLHWADDSFACEDKIVTGNSIDALLYERGSNPLMCNKLYSRALLTNNNIRFNESLSLGEDNAFQFTCFPYAKTIVFTSKMLYFYRIREGSAVTSSQDDHDAKLRLHFEVVQYVTEEWRKAGVLSGNESKLLSWAISFMHNEAARASFNPRAAFAQDFSRYFDNTRAGLSLASLNFDSWVTDKLNFILDAPKALRDKPEITIVLDSLDYNPACEELFSSIERQTEQRLEVIALAKGSSESYLAKLHDFAAKDRRIRILQDFNASTVMENAQGNLVLYTYSHVSYEPTAFKRLARRTVLLPNNPEEAPNEDALEQCERTDVLTFADSCGLLRAHDALDCCEPNPSTIFSDNQIFAASDFSDTLFTMSSLALCNKLFSASFLKANLAKEVENNIPMRQFLLNSLPRAKRIRVTTLPFASLDSLSFPDEKASRMLVCALQADIAATESRLAQCDSAHIDFSRACALYLLTIMRLCPYERETRMLFEQAHPLDGILRKALECPRLISENDRTCLDLLVANDYRRFREALNANTMHELIEGNKQLLLQVGDQAGTIEKLSGAIADFDRSVSFRVGRMVTLVPRKARELSARLLRR